MIHRLKQASRSNHRSTHDGDGAIRCRVQLPGKGGNIEMCRLYGFIANEPTKVDCSLVYAQNALILQSRIDERGLDHADGWGIATYHDGVPELLKRTTAAFEDRMFVSSAEKTYSQAIVAHVRKATVGEISLNNTHPFVHRNWTFAHNGTLTGFNSIGQRLAEETSPALQAGRKGQTDSEQFFLWLIARLQSAGLVSETGPLPDEDSAPWTTAATGILQKAVVDLAGRCEAANPTRTPRLNFVLTNGNTLFACRWNNSLHMIRRKGLYDCEICGIPHIHHHDTVNHLAVAVASEPVTHEVWQEVENRNVLAFNVTGQRTMPRGRNEIVQGT
jgi:glutamine amidotransferase